MSVITADFVERLSGAAWSVDGVPVEPPVNSDYLSVADPM